MAFTVEIMETGESSHTDIAICYMKGRVDEELLKKLKAYSEEMKEQVVAKDKKLQEVGYKNYTK